MIKKYEDWYINENKKDNITPKEFDKHCEFGDPKDVINSILDEEEFLTEFEDDDEIEKIRKGFTEFRKDTKDVTVAIYCTDMNASNKMTWAFDPYKHTAYHQEMGYGIYKVDMGTRIDVILRVDEQQHLIILTNLNGFLIMLNKEILPFSSLDKMNNKLFTKLGATDKEDFLHKNRGRLLGSKFGL